MGRQRKIDTRFYTAVADTPAAAERLSRKIKDLGREPRGGRPVRADRLGLATAIARCIPKGPCGPRCRHGRGGATVVPTREEVAVGELTRFYELRKNADGAPHPDMLTVDNATRIIEQARDLLRGVGDPC